MSYISRLAPTPSGFVHLGNVFNFLIICEQTRINNGKLILRIDDHDPHRCKREYIADIFNTLNFLDIQWDHGPKNINDHYQHWSQQNKRQIYFDQLQNLKNKFTCQCSRKKIAQHNTYPQYCNELDLIFRPLHHCIRHKKNPFPVIWRKEDIPAYHLVNVVEDETMKVTHIIRGNDLIESTQIHQSLAQDLQFKFFSKIHFTHHPLILGENGQKLSKSLHSQSVKQLINEGITKEKIFEMFKQWKSTIDLTF